MASTDDNRFLQNNNLLKLASRHNPETKINILDKELKEKFSKTFTVLMFNWELEEVEEKLGAEKGLELKKKALNVVRPILKKV